MTDRVIAGYEIEGKLGEGGMGVVYRARDTTLNRLIALKIIRPQSLSAQGKERFLREARACSAINHPNIVTVYAAGEDDGRPFLAMEFLQGRTIRDVIDAGPVPWRQAIGWTIDLLDALSRLHGEGIVHRDLKPENLFVTSDGRIKLMDFGIAHMGAGQTLTREGASLGTAHYMSPEQAAGKKVDGRSDLFSVASVLYEMLASKRPFDGEHPMAVMYSITNAPPTPLVEHDVELPDSLQAIIEKALEKDPEDRYADTSAFAAALGELIEPTPVASSQKRVIITLIAVGVLVAAALVVTPLVRKQVAERKRETATQHNELGMDYERQGKTLDAKMEYRRAAIADPTFALPWINLGALAMGEDPVEADSLFRSAVRADSTNKTALYNLATVRWDLEDYAAAEGYYEASIRADSSFAAGYNNLAALLVDRGRAPEALVTVWLGLEHSPDNPFLLKKLGQVQIVLGENDPARDSWLHGLDEARRRAQDKRLAREIDTTQEELLALIPDIHSLLGQSYEAKGDTQEAIRHWKAAADSEIAPFSANARAALDRIQAADSGP